MVRNVPMFDRPEPPRVELSQALAVDANRLIRGETARWTSVRIKSPRPCQECSQLQHETRGAFGPRRQVTHRRKHPYGGVLELCNEHTRLWKERDEQDAGVTRQ